MANVPKNVPESKSWLPLKSLRALVKRVPRGMPSVGQTPYEVAWSENKWRLLRFSPNPASAPTKLRTPVLLVPSLINRWYVLDLAPGRSLIEFLVGRGHDVFIIDWGTPGPEDRYLTWDDICGRYLGRAVRRVAALANNTSAGIHLLGYCLGGTMTVNYAAAFPDHVATLTTLAAPIDFSAAGIMTTWTRTAQFDVQALTEGFGNLPWPLMQASFQMLKPTTNASKAVALLDRAWDDEFLDGFLATERWGNDNVSFPGACYRDYIELLYRRNALLTGEMTLLGKPALLSAITCPLLSVSFKNDHIVPPLSSNVLVDAVRSSDKTLLELNGGHVGAVVSRKAASGLWLKLSDWWTARESR
jgi:polyhydroxyalkanoate synthase subunit PhaC